MKFSHEPQKHSFAALLFIVAMLLSAQASSLVHGVDHFNHEAHELCESFLVLDHSSSIIDSSEALSFELSFVTMTTGYSGYHSQIATFFYPIRAPPAFYS